MINELKKNTMKSLVVTSLFRNNLFLVLLAMLSFTVMVHSVTEPNKRRHYRSSSISAGTQAQVIYLPPTDGIGIGIGSEQETKSAVSSELPKKTRIPKFLLYTLNTRDAGEVITARSDILRKSHFVAGAPLKIYVHGFMSSPERSYALEFKSAYLQRNETINVVLVDWEHLAAGSVFKYGRAASNTENVGTRIAELITFLYAEHFIEFEDVHIIGHSLGAHVAGFAGRFIGAGRIGRITALDPAGPRFTSVQADERIDKSDAAFVDVIHTNTKILGLAEPVGHVDFYPNGGKSQPGCGIDAAGICSHGRANDYMIESINNPQSFYSWRCQNMVMCFIKGDAHMGEHVEHSARGQFYVKTHCEKPFSK